MFKKLNKALGKWAPFVSIAIMFIPGGQGVGAAMLKGFIAGGIASGSLKGALIGAFSAGIGFDVGGDLGFLGNGMVGGMFSSAMGGKFAHGFVSAGVSSQLTPGIQDNVSNAYARVAAHAIAGGTISAATGGKFANGAYSAAFASALREGAARMSDYRRTGTNVPLAEKDRRIFEKEFNRLKDIVADAGPLSGDGYGPSSPFGFTSSDAAAEWLHDNIHSMLTTDVEVGAYIYSSNGKFFIGELQTSYMSGSVTMRMVGQAHSSWHSHGTNAFYWRTSLSDVEMDIRETLRYGYTSTSWGVNGSLWRFDASNFSGNVTWQNTCSYLTNLRGRGC